MKVHAVATWHPFGFPRAFVGFADTDGGIYLMLSIEERAALAKDIDAARNWRAHKVAPVARGGVALGKSETFYSGEHLALCIDRAEITVSPFIGDGDSLAPRPGLTWGSAMILDAARKVAGAAKVALGPVEECWAK